MPPQIQLPIPIAHADVDGVEMGILDDGTPYLTLRGLASLCGIAPSTLSGWKYDPAIITGRDAAVRRLLRDQGYTDDTLHVRSELEGSAINAYPDIVCMAILEYYAFDSERGKTDVALKNFRLLARGGMRVFIYRCLGYDDNCVPRAWADFRERILLNSVPPGYFSAFSEMYKLVLLAIQGGLMVGPDTVPDISIGHAWSKFWTTNQLSEKWGQRITYEHVYPDMYPQAAGNPYDANCYPLGALGEFQIWFQGTYVPEYFPKYVKRKVKDGAIKADEARRLIELVQRDLSLVRDDEK